MLHIEFLTDLGAKVTVDVPSADKLLEVQRQYGRLGWTSGDVPAGGYQFPHDNESDFDWALIGARKWTNPEGEDMVIHRGHAYRRRELEAVDSRKMKLPAAVKYSRGAKTTDPEHIREKADGEFEYVTLAIFRGGKRQEKYAAHSGQAQSGQAQSGQPTHPRQPLRPAAAQATAPAQATQSQQTRPTAQPAQPQPPHTRAATLPSRQTQAPVPADEGEDIPF